MYLFSKKLKRGKFVLTTRNLSHGVFDGDAVIDVAGGDKLKVD
jgi:hypothetical protein